MLGVFAVGTLSFVDATNAASWKKYNSGTFKDQYPAFPDSKVGYYQSYVKGNNQLYVNIYSIYNGQSYDTKKLKAKVTFTKTNGVVKIVGNDYGWKEKDSIKFRTSANVKTVYKAYMKEFIKINKIPPSKAAFDTQTFKVDGITYKSYAIKVDPNIIQTYLYSSDYSMIYDGYITYEKFSFNIKKDKNTVTIQNYDEKRNVFYKNSFKSSKSVTSIYYEYMKSFREELYS